MECRNKNIKIKKKEKIKKKQTMKKKQFCVAYHNITASNFKYYFFGNKIKYLKKYNK